MPLSKGKKCKQRFAKKLSSQCHAAKPFTHDFASEYSDPSLP